LNTLLLLAVAVVVAGRTQTVLAAVVELVVIGNQLLAYLGHIA
jgi:hypothetical protein